NIGVHGHAVTLHLEKLWIRDVTITTGLGDTFSIPQLLRLIVSGRLDPSLFAAPRFPLRDTMSASPTVADPPAPGVVPHQPAITRRRQLAQRSPAVTSNPARGSRASETRFTAAGSGSERLVQLRSRA